MMPNDSLTSGMTQSLWWTVFDWPKIGVWAFIVLGCIFFWWVILDFIGVI
jgi:hypothetical protein